MTRSKLGRRASSVSSSASASGEVSSSRSSITSTTGSSSDWSSDSRRSTTAAPSNSGTGASRSTNASAPTAARSCSISESQKRCASCSLRFTDTQAARSRRPASSSHERSKTVLPLPAGAETSVTPLAPFAESTSNRALLATTEGALLLATVCPLTIPPSSEWPFRVLKSRTLTRSHVGGARKN